MELTSAVLKRGTSVKLRDSLVSVDSDAGQLKLRKSAGSCGDLIRSDAMAPSANNSVSKTPPPQKNSTSPPPNQLQPSCMDLQALLSEAQNAEREELESNFNQSEMTDSSGSESPNRLEEDLNFSALPPPALAQKPSLSRSKSNNQNPPGLLRRVKSAQPGNSFKYGKFDSMD